MGSPHGKGNIEAVRGGKSVIYALRGLVKQTPPPETQDRPATAAAADRYASVDVLGEGAFGKVLRVYDQDLKRELAVKILKTRPGREQQDIKRFVEEAQATAQLEHPNIVPVHELVAEEGQLYYTMKLLRGQTLEAVLEGLRENASEATKEWSLTALIQVFLGICQAIDFAHSRGVLHRDLKPENIMLGDYGEVIVMDWGLAKVVMDGPVRTEGARTLEGAILGSPAYMSPEQASGEVGKADVRADVWSLGVILYEILTLSVPFHSENTAWMLARILMEEPEPPRKRAPLREIPLELERICLRALSKLPDERHQSARELRIEVQAWLEAETERGRRHELAEAKASEGMRQLAAYRRLQADVDRLQGEIEALRQKLKPWQPPAEKRELFGKVRELEETVGELERCYGETVALFTTAVGIEAENRTARGVLAELYWEKFRAAEEAQEERVMASFRPLVELYHDGRYSLELKGDGSLELSSKPSRAEVWLYELVEEDLCLVPRGERRLGTTPLEPMTLPMGSYLLVLKKSGYRDVRYPVFITRNRHWAGTVKLYTEEQIGEDFVYVPAGPFIQGRDPGGDLGELGWAQPRTDANLEKFLIARHPVTMQEYLEFINNLARKDRAMAVARSPRRWHDEITLSPAGDELEGGSYLVPTADGLFALPEMDAEGDVWDPHWPVIGISWYDAIAYCEWRSRRDGRPYHLPSEEQWEKAARGVDGRLFPWGNRWDPSLCNMKDSLRDRGTVVAVEAFPTDASIYGVRGMGGNVRDWTASEVLSGEGSTARTYHIVRGGAWDFGPSHSLTAFRFGVGPTLVDGHIGFRLACSAPGKRLLSET